MRRRETSFRRVSIMRKCQAEIGLNAFAQLVGYSQMMHRGWNPLGRRGCVKTDRFRHIKLS